MKRFLPAIALLLTPLFLHAAESPDTISVKSTDVVVVESPTGVTVTINGSAEDPDYKYTYRADYPDGTQVNVRNENDFNFDFPFSKKKGG